MDNSFNKFCHTEIFRRFLSGFYPWTITALEEEVVVCAVLLTIRGHRVEVPLSGGVMSEATSLSKIRDRVGMDPDLDQEGIIAIIRDRDRDKVISRLLE